MSINSTRNRFDLAEFAGALGDLGTFIPFVLVYLTVLDMDPTAVLLAFGVALIVCGAVYRTPFPVQPMKAISATVVAHASVLTGPIVVSAAFVTAVLWFVLAITGWAQRLAAWVPRPALVGVIVGLGLSFMLEGVRMMATSLWIATPLLAATLLLLRARRLPPMLFLLSAGALIAIASRPLLLDELAQSQIGFSLPQLGWTEINWNTLVTGAVMLALPQLPLTFGNALVAITDENNRLFPDRPVSEGKVAFSTSVMNFWSSVVGGVPMCHGAGGMAAHVQFGAKTGGASIIFGVVLAVLALFFSDSVTTLLQLFPQPVLGVMLFLAGAQLALGSREPGTDKADRFLVLTTAAFTLWNVGAAIVYGILAYEAWKKGWLRI